MNKNDLRKCKIYYPSNGKNLYPDGEYYFHSWSQRGRVQRHPDYSSGDSTFVAVLAIVEHIESGKIEEVDPDTITFIS